MKIKLWHVSLTGLLLLLMSVYAVAAGPRSTSNFHNSAVEDCRRFGEEYIGRLMLDRGVSANLLPWNYPVRAEEQADGVGAEETAAQAAVALVQSETTYVWVGDHWSQTTRTNRTYAGNYLTELLVENWELGSWTNAAWTSYIYDANDSLLTTTYRIWFEGAWLNDFRTTNTYDLSGKLTGYLTEVWEAGAWVESSRAILTYSGDLVSEWRFQQKIFGQWMDNARVTYQYNASNQYTSFLTQSWNGTAWVNSSSSTYSYNGSAQLVELLLQTWQSNAWKNLQRNSYGYDVTNARILDVTYRWIANTWQATEADTFRYNGWHQLTERIDWLISVGAKYRYTYEFDPAWNVTAYNSFTWDEVAGWVNDTRFVYVYDTQLAVKLDDKPLPNGYDLGQNFPNPFNPRTAIRYGLPRAGDVVITVHNVLGQQVRVLEDCYQPAGIYETAWDGTNAAGQPAASGIYFYRITSGDFTATRKMVLLR